MVIAKIWAKYEEHDRWISSIGLVVGFIFDNLTISRTDYGKDMQLFFIYLLALGCFIFLLNLMEGEYFKYVYWKHTALMFFTQLLIGYMFSGFVVIYGRSASILSSWFFMLILAGLLIGNEFIKKHYARMTLTMSIYFLGIYSCMIFAIPVLLGQMGDWIFLLSGAVSVGLFLGFIYLLSRFVPKHVEGDRRQLKLAVGTIFFLINALYFLNIIPPIPLALKTADVYHSLSRDSDGNYALTHEDPPWYSFLQVFERVHLKAGDPLFVVTSIFAPTNFQTTIVHDWYHYNDAKSRWEFVSSVSFPVSGGRESGFRGYSEKDGAATGLWKVDVKTTNGQKLGTVKFKVVPVSDEPALVTEKI